MKELPSRCHMDIKLHREFTIEFTDVQGGCMASLTTIADALTQAEEALTTELAQIAEALMNAPTEEQVQEVANRVLVLKDRIANIIP